MIKHRHQFFGREGDCSRVFSVAWCGVESMVVVEGEDVNVGWDESIAWTLNSTTCEECKGAIGLGMLAGDYYD
jgi:hypothetical protein